MKGRSRMDRRGSWPPRVTIYRDDDSRFLVSTPRLQPNGALILGVPRSCSVVWRLRRFCDGRAASVASEPLGRYPATLRGVMPWGSVPARTRGGEARRQATWERGAITMSIRMKDMV